MTELNSREGEGMLLLYICVVGLKLQNVYNIIYISGGGAKNFILQDIVIEALMIKDAATGANIGWLLQFDET